MLFPDFLLTHHKPLPSGPQGGTITIHCCLAPVLTPLSLACAGIVSLVTQWSASGKYLLSSAQLWSNFVRKSKFLKFTVKPQGKFLFLLPEIIDFFGFCFHECFINVVNTWCCWLALHCFYLS